MSQNNIRAVNKAIKALDLDHDDRYAATVELARTLARQMDAAMPEPSTRLSAAFLSVLKDMQRARPDGARTPGYGMAQAKTEMERYMEEWG